MISLIFAVVVSASVRSLILFLPQLLLLLLVFLLLLLLSVDYWREFEGICPSLL